MKRAALYILAAAVYVSCGHQVEDVCGYVDPFIGTAYTGHTFPNAACPFGAMQPGPQSGNYGWDYCSGYVYDDDMIWGFSQNRLSGTGIPDLGDVLMMPFSKTSAAPDFRSSYRKEFQTASPGYYSVLLDDNAVLAEMTCTEHVALHRYQYRDSLHSLFLDLQSGQSRSRDDYETRVLDSEVRFEDDRTVSGWNKLHGWVDRKLYYVIRFNSPVLGRTLMPGDPRNKAGKYVLDFGGGEEELLVKVAFSYVGIDGARAAIEAELPGWDFDAVRDAARKCWRDRLCVASVEGSTAQKTAYYTSLYHLLLQPNNVADIDGRYCGADGNIHDSETGKYYSTLSQWDTFRAANPFYTLMYPETMTEIVNSMIGQYDAVGFLPIWALCGKENYCMVGNHSVPAVVSASLKGLEGIDAEKAYEAVRASLTESHWRSEWDIYDRYGYFPFDLIPEESVSRTLECGYDDWCAARLAERLGRVEDSRFFDRRAEYYKNLFDPESGFFRGKDSNGGWRTPFDKLALSHGGTSGGDYTEGNAWQYLWHVLQAPDSLIKLLGGREKFIGRLDSLFVNEQRAAVTGFVGDVTGLIGQYAHGNEPSHHVAYLYTLAGCPARTAEVVREIFGKFYLNRPDGLCGNDDCGQMSAWYLFSAMGFYPLNPASGEYVLGAPQIPQIRLSLPNGRTLTVVAENLSADNKYVKSASIDGETLGTTISHERIMNGGRLVFEMTSERL